MGCTQVKMSALEAELDKCASEVDDPSASSAFSMQALQPLADCSASRSRPGAAQPRFTPTASLVLAAASELIGVLHVKQARYYYYVVGGTQRCLRRGFTRCRREE